MQAGVGDLVAVGAADPGDQSVDAEAAQVVAGLAGGDLLGGVCEQGCEVVAQVVVGEPGGLQPELAQGGQQGVGAGVVQA